MLIVLVHLYKHIKMSQFSPTDLGLDFSKGCNFAELDNTRLLNHVFKGINFIGYLLKFQHMIISQPIYETGLKF